MRRAGLALLVCLLHAGTAGAHHRQTDPVVALTTAGDASLPRISSPSRRSAAVIVDGVLSVVMPFRYPETPTYIFVDGTNADPTLSKSGRVVAWDTNADPLQSGAPGRQIVRYSKTTGLGQVAIDPTGTSSNPTLDPLGLNVAFESRGDLAGTGNPGAQQIFLVTPSQLLAQISRGVGTSRNPALGTKAKLLTFDSTSDPLSGADTGVAQIWVADLLGGTTGPVTAGARASERPTLSNDSRLVVFHSRADLLGDGQPDVPQVYVYDTVSRTFARLTDDAGGCTDPTASHVEGDWRVAYLCSGTAYFTMLRANLRFRVATDGGNTTRIVAPAYAHFVLVATTANLLDGGTTSEHRVYLVNLFKRTPDLVPSSVTWFPFQGIPSR